MLKKLKILMVAPTPFFSDRGCHMQIYEQARALQKRGHEVQITTYHIGRDLSDIVTIRLPNIAPWYKKLTAGPSLTKIWLDFFLIFITWKVARKWRPDILHGHLHEGCFIGWTVSKLTGIPFIFDLQGSLVSEMVVHRFIKKGGIIYNFLFIFEKWLNKRPPAIMTHSTSRKKELIEIFELPEEKITTVFDGTNLELFHPYHKNQDLFKKYNIPWDQVLIVYLGRLEPYQGVDLLIESIPLVIENNPLYDSGVRRLFGKTSGVEEERNDGKTPDVEEKRRQSIGMAMKYIVPTPVHFLMFGYPDVEKYKEMAEKLGVGAYVTFSGRIDYERAGEHIVLGDIAITLKMDVEDNGKLYNYMACGLPVIALDNFVNREVVGENGFYVSESTPEAVSSTILKAISTPKEIFQKMGENGKRRIEKNFTWDKCAERMEKVYSRILNSEF